MGGETHESEFQDQLCRSEGPSQMSFGSLQTELQTADLEQNCRKAVAHRTQCLLDPTARIDDAFRYGQISRRLRDRSGRSMAARCGPVDARARPAASPRPV